MQRNQWPNTNVMGGRMLPESLAGWLRNTQLHVPTLFFKSSMTKLDTEITCAGDVVAESPYFAGST